MGVFLFGSGGKKDSAGPDLSQVTMQPQFGLSGKKFFDKNGNLKEGAILNWDGTPITLMDGDTVPGADIINPSLDERYIPSGFYLGRPIELKQMDRYSGSYSCIPGPDIGGGSKVLYTQNKYCTENVTVKPVRVKTVVANAESNPFTLYNAYIDYSYEETYGPTTQGHFPLVIFIRPNTGTVRSGYIKYAFLYFDPVQLSDGSVQLIDSVIVTAGNTDNVFRGSGLVEYHDDTMARITFPRGATYLPFDMNIYYKYTVIG